MPGVGPPNQGTGRCLEAHIRIRQRTRGGRELWVIKSNPYGKRPQRCGLLYGHTGLLAKTRQGIRPLSISSSSHQSRFLLIRGWVHNKYAVNNYFPVL